MANLLNPGKYDCHFLMDAISQQYLPVFVFTKKDSFTLYEQNINTEMLSEEFTKGHKEFPRRTLDIEKVRPSSQARNTHKWTDCIN